MFPSPKELDAQSKIKIDRWVDIGSAEWKELDDDPATTKLILRRLYEEQPAYLFTDTLGRLFGKGVDGLYYPYHFEHNGKLIGYRLSKKAAN